MIRTVCRGNWLAEETGSKKGTEAARDWDRLMGERTGEKCTSFDRLLPRRLSNVLLLGFSIRGEKFSLSNASAGVGSKAKDGDFGAMMIFLAKSDQ